MSDPHTRPRRPRLGAAIGAGLVLVAVACDSGSSGAVRRARGSAEREGGEEGGRAREEGEAPARTGDEPPAPSAPLVPPSDTAPLPVAAARPMATLGEPESASVCAWLAANAPRRHVECADGTALDVGVGADEGCPPAVAFAGCTLTIGEVAACMVANQRDPCAHGMFGGEVCRPFRECMLIQMGAIREGPPAE